MLLAVLCCGIWYSNLSNRHKAIVKTEFLHRTGLLDNQWKTSDSARIYAMNSPTFLIDGVYKSMEGPKASGLVQLQTAPELVFLTGFEVSAFEAKSGKPLPNDYICHTNIDINDTRYYSNFGLEDRIGKQYPRLTSLSNGQEQFSFPNGFGVPMMGNDLLYVMTESLNHNWPEEKRLIKHRVRIAYEKQQHLQPLMGRTIFIQLPFDTSDPYKGPLSKAEGYCIPVETKNHTYVNARGESLSGHWVIPRGKKYYASGVNEQLQIKDSLKLHAAAVHVHPFATSLELFDKTSGHSIFKSHIVNYEDRIGLQKVDAYASEQGVWLYENHDYELRMFTNNTSTETQDMMGSMFLFFHDAEMQARITTAN